MGYTFRHILLDFLAGYIDADIANTRFEGFRERYPKEAYYSMMNLVSSHDVPRIMTMLSRPEDTDDRDIQREEKVFVFFSAARWTQHNAINGKLI
jgi:4-alpha-glucanotransferase